MILDVLENAHRYQALNKGFAAAIEFLLAMPAALASSGVMVGSGELMKNVLTI